MNQVTSDEMENRVHQGLKRDLETMIQVEKVIMNE